MHPALVEDRARIHKGSHARDSRSESVGATRLADPASNPRDRLDGRVVEDRAMAYRDRGFSVFLVPAPVDFHSGKTPATWDLCGVAQCHPIIRWQRYRHRFATDTEIRGWTGGLLRNIAIVTGAISRVVVVDVDSPAAIAWAVRHLPRTPWQTKTVRGYHLFYRYPDVVISNKSRIETPDGRLAIDVRGDGGFVIAPGSLHQQGIRYAEAGDWNQPRSQLPVFQPAWVGPRCAPPSSWAPSRPSSNANVADRAQRYLATLPLPVIGQGSDTAIFCAAARLVRGFALPPSDAAVLLWAWAGNRPGWTREWIVSKVEHARRYGTEAVGGLLG